MPVCDVPCQDVFRCSSVNHQEFGSGILDFISLLLERRASVYVSEVQKNVLYFRYTVARYVSTLFLCNYSDYSSYLSPVQRSNYTETIFYGGVLRITSVYLVSPSSY